MDHDEQPHPVDVLVGERVRAARLAAGLSQVALGSRIGLSYQQVQKYENGFNRISASKLVEIADTLDAPAAIFLAGLARADRSAKLEGAAVEGAHDLLLLYAQLPKAFREAVIQLARTLVRGLPSLRGGSGRRGRAGVAEPGSNGGDTGASPPA